MSIICDIITISIPIIKQLLFCLGTGAKGRTRVFRVFAEWRECTEARSNWRRSAAIYYFNAGRGRNFTAAFNYCGNYDRAAFPCRHSFLSTLPVQLQSLLSPLRKCFSRSCQYTLVFPGSPSPVAFCIVLVGGVVQGEAGRP